MPTYLDLEHWPRRDAFAFFLDYDKPYFNVCVQVDVSHLIALVQSMPGTSTTLAYHYLALRLANEIEPFRYRLEQGRVRVHDVVHGGTTVLRDDNSFTFAFFDYLADYAHFAAGARAAMDQARTGSAPLRQKTDDAVIHFTTLPWIAFTGFSHARNWRREDSIPKIAFGKFVHADGRVRMPLSIEVHHSLMDGVHVGSYLERFEAVLQQPAAYLALTHP